MGILKQQKLLLVKTLTNLSIRITMAIVQPMQKDDDYIESAPMTKGRRYSLLQHIFLITTLCIILTVFLITSYVLIEYMTNHGHYYNDHKTEKPFPKSEIIVAKLNTTNSPYRTDLAVGFVLPGNLKTTSRQEWLAQPPQEKPLPLANPVPYVIILDTASESCSDRGKCTFNVRFLQNFHIDSRGWNDIIYNFLVGGDGYAYEGRGWQAQGAHTLNYNSESVGIAFIGTFINEAPPERQILAAKQLIQEEVEKGFIAEDYKLFGARQLANVKTPGERLMEELKTWPHWAEKP